MLYYYLILLTNNHSTLNYIVILINLLTYLGTIPGTQLTINSNVIINNKQIILLSRAKFEKNIAGTWNIPVTKGSYKIIIRSADSTGGSGGVGMSGGTDGYPGTKGETSKVDSIIVESPVPGNAGIWQDTNNNNYIKATSANICDIGSFITGNVGQLGTGDYSIGNLELFKGGNSGCCQYIGTTFLSNTIQVIIGKNRGMPQKACIMNECGGLPGEPRDGLVTIEPL